jgi:hypothetical protein
MTKAPAKGIAPRLSHVDAVMGIDYNLLAGVFVQSSLQGGDWR